MKQFLIILFSSLMAYSNLQAQDLSSHQWKNRLVLILTEDPSKANFQKQLEELKDDEKGLADRKLLIYQITPTRYKVGLRESDEWQQGSYLYHKYRTRDAGLEIKLLGLDGGVKLEQAEFLSKVKLFSVIDGMPMRQAEIRNKNK